MITKGDLIKGAMQHLAADGLLMQPMAQDNQAALQHLDDFAATYAAIGQDIGYLQPLEYGTSTESDDSGVDVSLVGPMKVLLAGYIANMFGKELNPNKLSWAENMMMRQLTTVESCSYPITLPVGSGNYEAMDDQQYYRGGLPFEN
jgi:hypothetical protein